MTLLQDTTSGTSGNIARSDNLAEYRPFQADSRRHSYVYVYGQSEWERYTGVIEQPDHAEDLATGTHDRLPGHAARRSCNWEWDLTTSSPHRGAQHLVLPLLYAHPSHDEVSAEVPGWQFFITYNQRESASDVERLRRVIAAIGDVSAVVREGAAHPTPAAISSAQRLITRFTRSEGPTPQIGATASGSLELAWLRRGLMLSFIIDADGSVAAWCQDSTGIDRFEFEARSPDSFAVGELAAITAVLEEMSAAHSAVA